MAIFRLAQQGGHHGPRDGVVGRRDEEVRTGSDGTGCLHVARFRSASRSRHPPPIKGRRRSPPRPACDSPDHIDELPKLPAPVSESSLDGQRLPCREKCHLYSQPLSPASTASCPGKTSLTPSRRRASSPPIHPVAQAPQPPSIGGQARLPPKHASQSHPPQTPPPVYPSHDTQSKYALHIPPKECQSTSHLPGPISRTSREDSCRSVAHSHPAPLDHTHPS